MRHGANIAWVASVSVGWWGSVKSKKRPKNGIFGVLPARKMGQTTETPVLWSFFAPNPTETLATLRRLKANVNLAPKTKLQGGSSSCNLFHKPSPKLRNCRTFIVYTTIFDKLLA